MARARSMKYFKDTNWKSNLLQLLELMVKEIDGRVHKGNDIDSEPEPSKPPSPKRKRTRRRSSKDDHETVLVYLHNLFLKERNKLKEFTVPDFSRPHKIHGQQKNSDLDEDKGWSIITRINCGLYDLHLEYSTPSPIPGNKKAKNSEISSFLTQSLLQLYPNHLPPLPRITKGKHKHPSGPTGTDIVGVFHKIWYDGLKALDQYCCGHSLYCKDKPIHCYVNPDHVILPGDPFTVARFDDCKQHKLCSSCAETVRFRAEVRKDGTITNFEPIRDPHSGLNRISGAMEEAYLVSATSYTDCFNRYQNPVPTVVCGRCSRKYHTVCVHYYEQVFKDKRFICSGCNEGEGRGVLAFKINNKYPISSSIPHTQMTSLIETRVRKILETHCNDVSSSINGDGQRSGEVYIREIASISGATKMKENYSAFLRGNDMKDQIQEFPYTKRCIFAFQDNPDGIPYMFFAMYVYEYDQKNCPLPNRGIANISYLDSVPFLVPSSARRKVHQEILIGYADYIRSCGLDKLWIWVCPPKQGEDFILNVHPPCQSYLTVEKLMDWYVGTLNKGQVDGIIEYHETLPSYLLRNPTLSILQLPYLEDDRLTQFYEDETPKFKLLLKKSSPKKLKLTNGSSGNPSLFDHFEKYVRACMAKRRECGILVANLKTISEKINNPEIPRASLQNKIPFTDRERFLEWSKNKGFQFSSVNHSIYSTMGIMDQLFNGFDSSGLIPVPKIEARRSLEIKTIKLGLEDFPGLSKYSNPFVLNVYYEVLDHIVNDRVRIGEVCPRGNANSSCGCQSVLKILKDVFQLKEVNDFPPGREMATVFFQWLKGKAEYRKTPIGETLIYDLYDLTLGGELEEDHVSSYLTNNETTLRNFLSKR